jgi:hypothetical protein
MSTGPVNYGPTPGPWRVHGGVYVVTAWAEPLVVARVAQPGSALLWASGPAAYSTLSNARLVAAAPDLRDALHALCAACLPPDAQGHLGVVKAQLALGRAVDLLRALYLVDQDEQRLNDLLTRTRRAPC